jgi:DNA-directed RNA polymerase subunit RPC12/RpoP
MRQKGEPVTCVEAVVQFLWQCPKCGKWCANEYTYAKCPKCQKRVTLKPKKREDFTEYHFD